MAEPTAEDAHAIERMERERALEQTQLQQRHTDYLCSLGDKCVAQYIHRMDACSVQLRVNELHQDWQGERAVWDSLRRKFAGTLIHALDVQPLVVARLVALEYVTVPRLPKDDAAPNYVQLLTMEPRHRDPVREVLHYLVYERESQYSEAYQRDAFDQAARQHTLHSLRSYYRDAKFYGECVSLRLWCREDYMATHYTDELAQLQRLFDKL